jgi:hypothetical protein
MKILLPILFLFVQNNITRNRNQRWKKTGRQAANRKPNKKERMGWVQTDLNAVIGADEVLIYGLEPAHIVMGVTHQVHIQLPIHKRRTGVVESGSELQELRILLLSSSSSIKPPTTDDGPEKRLQQPQEADHIPPPPHHYPPTHHHCAPVLLFLLLPVPSQNTHRHTQTP